MALDKVENINSDFVKRTASLILLIAIYFFVIISDSYISNIIIYITSLILSFECFAITQENKEKKYFLLFLTLVLLNIFVSTLTNFFFSINFTIFFSSLILLKIFFTKLNFRNILWLFSGFIYITIPLIIFFEIKESENGIYIILWLFSIVCSTDIFSYIFGKLIKGPKIFPKISPSKTYSGTFLGIIAGTIFGILFFVNYLNLINTYIIVLLSLSVSISGLLGDLFLSKIKRKFKVKDSGKTLPGHGGFLDRYDSISFGLISLFFIQYFL